MLVYRFIHQSRVAQLLRPNKDLYWFRVTTLNTPHLFTIFVVAAKKTTVLGSWIRMDPRRWQIFQRFRIFVNHTSLRFYTNKRVASVHKPELLKVCCCCCWKNFLGSAERCSGLSEGIFWCFSFCSNLKRRRERIKFGLGTSFFLFSFLFFDHWFNNVCHLWRRSFRKRVWKV